MWFYRQENLRHLTPCCRCLLLYIAEKTDFGKEVLNQTYPEIGEYIDISPNTIKRCLKELKDLGMVDLLNWNGRAHKIKLVAPTTWRQRGKNQQRR